MKHLCLFAWMFFALLPIGCPGVAYEIPDEPVKKGIPDPRIYNILKIVQQKAAAGVVVKVAVVDNGFRLSHKTIRDFIYTNTGETPANFQDDDGNGYTDDMHGWDMSDNDNDVSVRPGKENRFYHGTYIAGIIASIFQRCYGDSAFRHLQIIPVKVLSDHAENSYFKDGYKGIRYATDLGADIICCAWSGGDPSDEEKRILNTAISKGIMIIGAAGNFYTEKADAPSSFPGVFCVASLDTLLKKSKYSNYGMRIDIAAPGDSVYGPHPAADNAYIHENGTSPASAIITGCATVLKALVPKATTEDILNAIRNTAVPVDSLNLTYCGKLGAGLPNMEKAIEFMKVPDFRFSTFSALRPKGNIYFNRKKSPHSWSIHPSGAYKGIHIVADCKEPKKMVQLFTGDSLWYAGPLSGISRMVFIPGSRFRIDLQPATGLPKDLVFSYYMETIDSTSLYCRGIHDMVREQDSIRDGSGDENYANNCSCKWQISVPAGKRIRMEFLTMDTQPNVDFVWIFDGTSPLPENILAKFSGTSIPPVITSFTNNVLVWFLSDGHTVGKGWSMKYSSSDL